jgi:hypothetical protein
MKTKRWVPFVALLAGLSLLAAQVEPALADGGLVYPDRNVWALIQEGQQIAVIQLKDENTVLVDLFITMVDRSGSSHQVTFFVPLGQQASQFNVVEQRSQEFDKALTKKLDTQIEDYTRLQVSYKSTVQTGLLLGALMTNGLWTWLVSLPLLASGCAQVAAPKATFATESSVISIFSLDQHTDVGGLIETTGLDPGVQQTLEALRGQEIAVVKLQTKPEAATNQWLTAEEVQGQPGIHLTWASTLVSGPRGGDYTYPLGTGRAWASPIELTRVYVIAPAGSDFGAEYPRLGTDLSGMKGGGWSSWGGLAARIYWRIDEATTPAYAIDEGFGSYGHIWRATFVKSNSDRDITITRLPQVSQATASATRQSQFQLAVTYVTWLISLIVGAALWVTAWKLVMTRIARASYGWREGRLYKDAFLWSVLYPVITLGILFVTGVIVAGLFLFLLSSWYFLQNSNVIQLALVLVIGSPLIACIAGLFNAFFFARSRSVPLGISRGRAFGAYMLTILVANALYVAYALIYYYAVAGWIAG